MILMLTGALSQVSQAQAPPPPSPSKTTTSGAVTNPVTGLVTIVSKVVSDNNPTVSAREPAFIQTADGYTFLVKAVGERFWVDGSTLIGVTVLAKTGTDPAGTVRIDADPAGDSEVYQINSITSVYDAQFNPPAGAPGDPPLVPSPVGGATQGYVYPKQGGNGGGGSDATLWIDGGRGGNGATPGANTVTHAATLPVNTSSASGITIYSIGGNGGNGGDIYVGWSDPGAGGTGGAGGAVDLTNNAQIQVSGNEHHGINAYSVSGRGGNGGSGYVGAGGGYGGASGGGGAVVVRNNGNIFTTGDGAHGILAVSRSGQGGAGGSTYGLVGSGGSGAQPGDGGTVTVTNALGATIQTNGKGSHGIFAMSVGGQGGAGGFASSLFTGTGGAGGGGGDGKAVKVTNDGTIITLSDLSRGIFAQSVGGGGGSGGYSIGLVAFGGTGSLGGSSGTVTVSNAGGITTSGKGSDGIFAQSVAGSGGTGGSSGGLVSLGGGAGPGGDGELVKVTNTGNIVTSNSLVRSIVSGELVFTQQGGRGIVAQSIGGGGGDGGSATGMVSVGGGGESGGNGGLVTVVNSGEIYTKGTDAAGIFAQSVGGGGGNGGSATSVGAFVAVAVGGSGAGGGAGGAVNVSLQGQSDGSASTIQTEGRNSFGVFGQSVGGGGGNGGGATSVSVGFGGAVSIAVGGDGGPGGAGGIVMLDDGAGGTNEVTTLGNNSTGVFAQSVGGGGGNGGYSTSVAVSAGPAAISVAVSIGGEGGIGGVGGTVVVGHDRHTSGPLMDQLIGYDGSGALTAGDTGFNGTINTGGDFSTGFIAQSVGGGGGNGGMAVSVPVAASVGGSLAIGVGVGGDAGDGSHGGEVRVGTAGNVSTTGNFSPGMLIQSVGGGGGNGGSSVVASVAASGGAAGAVSVGLGGKGGAGSMGGNVNFAAGPGLVWTKGESSTGITAQSIGGGGGNGGYNVSAALAGAGGAAGAVSVGLGGDGGAGGMSGTVTTHLQSDVLTEGIHSTGILVQAVGGGGGNGGFNVSAAIGGSGGTAGAVSVGLGGNGGEASDGGIIDATATGTITTLGHSSSGFIAQSVGGGGGNGGFNVSASGAGAGVASGAVSVGLGGTGAGGGAGGKVTASTGDNTMRPGVTTYGDNSTGILAQSVGGGGGNGGFNVSVAVSGSGVAAGAVGIGLGGSGGGGGDGGEVNLTVRNNVETGVVSINNDLIDAIGNATNRSGHYAPGVVAQSIGGGGGNGGFNVTVGIAGSGTVAGSVGVGLGGDGAMGGEGTAPVTLDMQGNITTRGDYAGGLIAQSVGGGGGNGGFNVSAAISGAGTTSGAVSVGLGGAAGGGGDALGQVTSRLTGDVTTVGSYSTGVTAQSLGGGGGNGGFNISGAISGAGTTSGAVGVGLGGSGGDGGKSGTSTTSQVVNNTVIGNVVTMGANSGGVLAQSMGGGGGNGGFNVSGTISGATGTSGAVSVGLGGSGGGGGNSAAVFNRVTGDVSTSNTNAFGVLAQSVGGGGGNGGFNVSGAISGSGSGASGGVSVGIGGSGGNGGHSGAVVTAGPASDGKVDTLLSNDFVVVDNAVIGNVSTAGASSSGVVAQSLGGGGGNGGFNVAAVLSGGGNASGAVSVGLGGSGGDGGHSASVKNSVSGNVTTTKKESMGVVAQSVGGGGGNGGFNVSGSITGSPQKSVGVSVGIGGSGGGGGQSGNIDNTVIGNVSTMGDDSSGVVAQSIGGGGGNGGFNISGVISAGGTGSGAVSVGIGGSGGDGGDSGNVTNRVTGDVMTIGNRSTAVMAQSLGGGGGNGGINVTANVNLSKEAGGTLGVGVGGFGGGGGDAGSVTSTVATATQNRIFTTGDKSSAVVAQSIGGGGGNGGVNVTGNITLTGKSGASIGVGVGGFGGDAGAGGDVDAIITGNYDTRGKDADAIIVQSLGGGGGNGGLNVTGQLGISTGGSTSQASVGIGGFGGSGGKSGAVTLIRTGDTGTTGANSEAIIVQSLAGGGGNGGVNVTAGLAASKSDNASLNFGLGGFGGTASNAGTVDATIIGNVWATGLGDGSAGDPPSLFSGAVVVQSVGGGGGTGGLNVSGGVNLTKSSSSGKVATIGIGGFGGGGGNADDVTLDIHAPGANRVSVIANGDNRAAVIAQSLGGGGGLGGTNISGGIATNSSLAFGMGGFGGDGGLSKSVTASVISDLQVIGDGARGLIAQSLGGGGGAGGINVSGTATINSNDDTSITFGLGGFGGSGNISGDVDVTQKGLVIVNGDNGIGVLAQSVAGGGGDGGLNVSANVTNAGTGKSTNRIVAGVGGDGGDGGAHAGDVKLVSVGAVYIIGSASNPTSDKTTVFNSSGILAQSIGGGGGLGGMNITASVARNAGNTLQFGMGGSGGAGGISGAVIVARGYETLNGPVANASLINTVGDYSNGLVAQSVGGGGGSAGMNFNFSYNKESNPEDGKKYTAAIITLGGSGADAGDGNVVTVRHNGDIITDGANSLGIVGQSIGGGGGASNINLGAGVLGEKTKGVNIGVGGANGTAGNAKLVDVTHFGTIRTKGDWSIGMKAQSIGGGGGSTNAINQFLDPILDFATGQFDSSSLSVSVGRKGGAGGVGGEVRANSNGSIITDGDQSIGILAQSIGGGGGDSGTTTVGGDHSFKSGSYGGAIAVGIDGGSSAIGGKVTVATTGMILTMGERAHAIFAQSVGGGGGMGGSVGDKLALSPGEDEDTTRASINVGGNGGDGSISGIVTVANSAMLQTMKDRSSGIWAQSVGGTGGTGGDYLQANIENIKSGKTSRTFGVNVGGNGGTGAHGGEVVVTNDNRIQTDGLQSFGIRAESIGGGGGDGGAVSNGTFLTGSGTKQSVNVNVGGSGGGAGNGKQVSVSNEGTIITGGRGADGIRATSTGGGGGNGGVIINTLLSLSGASSQTQDLSFNYGGKGGGGGKGGEVAVRNLNTTGEGAIQTGGESAHGIFAQSLGGGGGNGSSIISMTGLRNSKDSVAVGLNFGGAGGSGDNFGQKVTVENSGTISASGKDAYGILAQSIGGGGGNGGLAIAASAAFGEKSKSPVLAIGGAGGDGGNGGEVVVTNTGNIFTSGAGGHGIVAQSIGGGGGNAGMGIAATNDAASFAISNLVSLAAGAAGGGTGGIGGEVKVTHSGNITVTGEGAHAIMAESINGGGGHLKFDLSGVVGMPGFAFKNTFAEIFGITSTEAVIDPKIATRLGGTDQSNLNASKVTVISTGDFGVGGDNSVASFEQSLGGGGGTLFLKTKQVDAADIGSGLAPTAISYQVNMGGTNGVSNSGADIAGTSDGSILTTGFNSGGVLSQTVGGGGGHAIVDITAEPGALVGPIDVALGSGNGQGETGGNILRQQNGGITTTKDLSAGLQMQSIGGGGGSGSVVVKGNAVAHLDLLLGAINTNDSIGGNVDLTRNGSISTFGSQSQGVSVQSIGGGGGRVVASVGSNLSTAKVVLGADPSFDNHGGAVSVNFTGDVAMAGDYSPGLVLQSIGAGGGQSYLAGFGNLDLGLGASDGSTGNGGIVDVMNVGSIRTDGILSDGAVLQSIGGGGGYTITDLAASAVTVTKNTNNGGNGGNITFMQTGDIIVQGEYSFGVLAQSLGGGGGVVDRILLDAAGGVGDGGTISLAIDGNVAATGNKGVGIFAQSRGSGTRGDIAISLTAGKMLTFGTGGTGAWFSGGAQNSLLNNAIIIGTEGVLGWGARGEEGNEVVDNYGAFYGQFDLGAGDNQFTNHIGGLFAPGPVLNLGAASNLVTNNGVMMPGDMNNAQRSDLNGSFVQSTTGLTRTELDFMTGNQNVDGGKIDRIYTTGAVKLAGEIDVTLLNPQLVPSGRYQKTIFDTDLGVTDDGMVLTTAPSVVITYDLTYPNPNQAVLDYNVDFSPDGANLGQNLEEVGNYFNRIQAAGSSPALADTVIKMLYDPTFEEYRKTLSQMGPDFYGELQASAIHRGERFGHLLASGGGHRIVEDDYSMWFNYGTESGKHDSYLDYKRIDNSSDVFSVGFEKKIKENWMVGLGFTVEDHRSVGYGGQWQSEGDSRQLGFVLKHYQGNTEYAATLAYGWGQSDIERTGLVSSAFMANANRDLETFSGMLQVSHNFATGEGYIRPTAGVGFTHLMADHAMETGAGALNLQLQEYDETHVWARLGVGLGRTFTLESGNRLNLHGDLGFQYYLTNGNTTARARLEGAPAGIDPMAVDIDLNQAHGYGSIGVDLITPKGVTFGLDYSTILDSHSSVNRWDFSVTIPFQ